MEKKVFYVYGWIREDYNTYFYIGKGFNNRKDKISCRTPHFQNILNHTSCHNVIIQEGLTEQEALDLEVQIIKDLVENQGYSIEVPNFGKKNTGKHLVNQTWGGEGTSGFTFTMPKQAVEKRVAKCIGQKRTQEQIENLKRGGQNRSDLERVRLMGKRDYCQEHRDRARELGLSHKGKELSSEHKEKIAQGVKNMSQESKDKRTLRTKEVQGKSVHCKEINKTFLSLREIEPYMLEHYGLRVDRKRVSKCCKGLLKEEWYKELEINGVMTKLHWSYV